eukprot:4752225-Pyramimonas_sp.AAC.1
MAWTQAASRWPRSRDGERSLTHPTRSVAARAGRGAATRNRSGPRPRKMRLRLGELGMGARRVGA